jgi:hypothetical protein
MPKLQSRHGYGAAPAATSGRPPTYPRLCFGSVPLGLKENAFAGPTEASDSSSLSSILTLATWREARGESKEAQRGIFRTVVNREAKYGWWDTDAVVSVSLKLRFSCLT